MRGAFKTGSRSYGCLYTYRKKLIKKKNRAGNWLGLGKKKKKKKSDHFLHKPRALACKSALLFYITNYKGGYQISKLIGRKVQEKL